MPKKKAPAVIEPAFTVVKQRWGTFTSVDADGKKIVTSLSEQGCIAATHYYLKAKQDGPPEDLVKHEDKVDNKL